MYKFFNQSSLARLSQSELEKLLAEYTQELAQTKSDTNLPAKIEAVKTALKLKCAP